MPVTTSAGGFGNQLLDVLNGSELQLMAGHIQQTAMPVRKVFHKQGESIAAAYFPTGGMGSVTRLTGDGGILEVASAGYDGMIGVDLFLGQTIALNEAIMQIGGPDGWCIAASHFREAIHRRGQFWDVMRRYMTVFLANSLQSMACYGLHSVESRCCRWLLLTHDRLRSERIRVSQEFLSVMLGVRRPTVTIVLGTLARAGLVELHRREICVVDRLRLEAASCECYFDAIADYRRILPECRPSNG
jgi:CRP-like cAMP-binding protein